MEFIDKVMSIDKEPEETDYTVLFCRHAAVYTVKTDNRVAVEILLNSQSENMPVKVIHDDLTREITAVDIS